MSIPMNIYVTGMHFITKTNWPKDKMHNNNHQVCTFNAMVYSTYIHKDGVSLLIVQKPVKLIV